MKGPWNLLSRGPSNQIKRSPQPLDSYLCTVFILMSLLATNDRIASPFSPFANGQTTKFSLHDEPTVQRIRENCLGFRFSLKR